MRRLLQYSPISLIIALTIVLAPPAGAQTPTSQKDTTITIPKEETQAKHLDAPVHSKAKDSLRYNVRAKNVELYGEGELKHKNQEFKADYITIDLSNRQLYARGVKDSTTGEIHGEPVFIESGTTYSMTDITYNFNSQKARITGVFTEVTEGYMHGEIIKKMPNDEIYVKSGKFTTCDEKHPHFYIGLTKAKVIPDDKIVTGPAYLVIADVPTPLILPFGFFPNTTKRASGIILPEYGEEHRRGFFVRNGGFYLGLSDYVDATILASYYTKGSWDASLGVNYALRYKFTGRVGVTYSNIQMGQEGTPDRVVSNTYQITWSHTQDRASNPNSTFQANVTFGSSGYNKYNAQTTQDYLNNQTMSSISYSRQFPGTPFSLSTSLNHSQSSRDSIVNLRLPQISINMARIYPFKRRKPIGKQRWYERIGLNYSTNLQNELSIKEDKLFTKEALKKMRNGMQHQASLSTSFTILKHINISPSISYNEKWYLKSTRYHWEDSLKAPVRDTVDGFARAWNFNTGISTSTKIYGMYAFRPTAYVKAIRHVLTPSVGLSYHPDFSDPKFKMYREVQKNERGEMMKYSIFEQAMFGGPPTGQSGTISMSLGNNIEMKVKSKKDTAKDERKVPILESLNFSTGYNILADSMNWGNLSISARTNLFNLLNLNASTQFSPYAVTPEGRITKEFHFRQTKQILRFQSFSFSCGFSLNHALRGRKEGAPPPPPLAYLPGYLPYNPEMAQQLLMYEYADFSAPWDIAVNYSYSFSKHGKRVSTYQSASLTGGFSLDGKWRFSLSTGYDFNARKINMTSFNVSRDLHCWEMYLNVIPFGTMRSFSFRINVKAGVLQDLKYNKERSYIDNL